MTVSRILSTKGRAVYTVEPEQTIGVVAQILSSKGIGAAVVSSGAGDVLGIISERDIVHAIAKTGAAALSETVERHMTERVITAQEKTTLESLMQTMTSGRFRHVPVVESGSLCGLVSIGDVVKLRLEEFEVEQQALKDYIATA
ncbi:MAG: putative signal-transduction protein with domain [Hyphomicrobiales bacterium]|nr:putative signal-transduction protein with domain [Hyphomicrobiales bacterium]